jgi:excisionase family DNA binding protein
METGTKAAAYSIAEVAQLLGISRSAAIAATKRGDLPSIRIGRRRFVPRAALDKMLETGTRAA